MEQSVAKVEDEPLSTPSPGLRIVRPYLNRHTILSTLSVSGEDTHDVKRKSLPGSCADNKSVAGCLEPMKEEAGADDVKPEPALASASNQFLDSIGFGTRSGSVSPSKTEGSFLSHRPADRDSVDVEKYVLALPGPTFNTDSIESGLSGSTASNSSTVEVNEEAWQRYNMYSKTEDLADCSGTRLVTPLVNHWPLSQDVIDYIESLSKLIKASSLGSENDVKQLVDDLSECAIHLARQLEQAHHNLERLGALYQTDNTRIEETVNSLRKSRDYLESERYKLPNLIATLTAARSGYLTGLNNYQAKKWEYQILMQELEDMRVERKDRHGSTEKPQDQRKKPNSQLRNMNPMFEDNATGVKCSVNDKPSKALEESIPPSQWLGNGIVDGAKFESEGQRRGSEFTIDDPGLDRFSGGNVNTRIEKARLLSDNTTQRRDCGGCTPRELHSIDSDVPAVTFPQSDVDNFCKQQQRRHTVIEKKPWAENSLSTDHRVKRSSNPVSLLADLHAISRLDAAVEISPDALHQRLNDMEDAIKVNEEKRAKCEMELNSLRTRTLDLIAENEQELRSMRESSSPVEPMEGKSGEQDPDRATFERNSLANRWQTPSDKRSRRHCSSNSWCSCQDAQEWIDDWEMMECARGILRGNLLPEKDSGSEGVQSEQAEAKMTMQNCRNNDGRSKRRGAQGEGSNLWPRSYVDAVLQKRPVQEEENQDDPLALAQVPVDSDSYDSRGRRLSSPEQALIRRLQRKQEKKGRKRGKFVAKRDGDFVDTSLNHSYDKRFLQKQRAAMKFIDNRNRAPRAVRGRKNFTRQARERYTLMDWASRIRSRDIKKERITVEEKTRAKHACPETSSNLVSKRNGTVGDVLVAGPETDLPMLKALMLDFGTREAQNGKAEKVDGRRRWASDDESHGAVEQGTETQTVDYVSIKEASSPAPDMGTDVEMRRSDTLSEERDLISKPKWATEEDLGPPKRGPLSQPVPTDKLAQRLTDLNIRVEFRDAMIKLAKSLGVEDEILGALMNPNMGCSSRASATEALTDSVGAVSSHGSAEHEPANLLETPRSDDVEIGVESREETIERYPKLVRCPRRRTISNEKRAERFLSSGVSTDRNTIPIKRGDGLL